MADTLIPPLASVFVTDELLEQRAADDADMGEPDMPRDAWGLMLAADVGLVAQSIVGDDGGLRERLIRLAVDSVAFVDQLDRESGRAPEQISGSGVPLVGADAADEGEAESATAPPPPATETRWTGTQWRALAKSRGVKVADAIRHAQVLANEAGVDVPGTLEDICEGAVADGLRAWIEAGGR